MTKIIYIIYEIPAYAMYKEAEISDVQWLKNNGKPIGVFEADWGVRLGNAVLSETDQLGFEVWRPDSRADKLYTYEFENGLIHKSFPAKNITINNRSILFSEELLLMLRKEKDVIIHGGLNGEIFWYIGIHYSNIPFVGTSHGLGFLPFNKLFRLRKNMLQYYFIAKNHFLFKRFLKHVDCITHQARQTKDTLIKKYHVPPHILQNITMGADFDFFRPMNKSTAREYLNIDKDETVLLSVCRLNPRKQVDKLLQVFQEREISKFHFKLYVVGNGLKKYENYLKETARELINAGKVVFVGNTSSSELVYYYNAADLFLQTAYSEAGPVTSMEALACETPVFSTNTGRVAEVLNVHNKGMIVRTKDYKQWKECMRKFMEGKPIEILDRETARQYFSWSSVAKKFIHVYQQVLKNKQPELSGDIAH